MTKEEKELLLKDLCARLPYKVIIKSVGENKIIGLWDLRDIDNLPLPYLRPMSSMTMEDLQNLSNEIGLGVAFDNEKYELWLKGHTTILDNSLAINWLLENHFDFMGLIEKGLALEAPEGMYKHIV